MGGFCQIVKEKIMPALYQLFQKIKEKRRYSISFYEVITDLIPNWTKILERKKKKKKNTRKQYFSLILAN